jgi:hypothetical protein
MANIPIGGGKRLLLEDLDSNCVAQVFYFVPVDSADFEEGDHRVPIGQNMYELYKKLDNGLYAKLVAGTQSFTFDQEAEPTTDLSIGLTWRQRGANNCIVMDWQRAATNWRSIQSFLLIPVGSNCLYDIYIDSVALEFVASGATVSIDSNNRTDYTFSQLLYNGTNSPILTLSSFDISGLTSLAKRTKLLKTFTGVTLNTKAPADSILTPTAFRSILQSASLAGSPLGSFNLSYIFNCRWVR